MMGSKNRVRDKVLVLGLTLSVLAAPCMGLEEKPEQKKRSTDLQKISIRRIGNVVYRNSVRRQRPSIGAPPYAVPMEPLVKYSQRDPLYDQNDNSSYAISSVGSKTDYDSESSNNLPEVSNNFRRSPQHPFPYYSGPEPIIEIIIKESNESLPAPTTQPPPPSTKEPIHVFYVKYKKNPHGNGEGGSDIIYEEPVPALTPHASEIVEGGIPDHPQVDQQTYPSPPLPSTTLRTVIRPDSEVYHSTGLKVTFGGPHRNNHEEELEQSAPEPQVTFPDSQEPEVKEKSTSTNHYSKRQQSAFDQKQIRQEQQAQEQALLRQAQEQTSLEQAQEQVLLQQAQEQEKYRIPTPGSSPKPTSVDNLRQPGLNTQRQFQRNNPTIAVPQAAPHTTAIFHGAHSHQLTRGPPTWQHQHNYRQPEQGLTPPQQQFREPHRVVPQQRPPNPSNQHTVDSTRQQNRSPFQPPLPIEIQQYQQHKQFLHEQNLRQQALEKKKQAARFPATFQSPQIQQTRAQNNQPLEHPAQIRVQQQQIHIQHSPIIDHFGSLQTKQYVQTSNIQNTGSDVNNNQPINLTEFDYGTKTREKSFPKSETRLDDQQRHFLKLPQYNNHEQSSNENSGITSEKTIKNVDNQNQVTVTSTAEIVKSISPLESHQIQPAYKNNIEKNVEFGISQQNVPNIDSKDYQYQNHQIFPKFENREQLQYQNRPSVLNFEGRESQQYKNHQSYPNTEGKEEHIQNSRPKPENRYQIYNTRNEQNYYNQPKSTFSSVKPSITEPPHGTQRTQASKNEDKKEDENSEIDSEEEKKRKEENIAALPEEVPEDLRAQLLSSGILGNADIQILDYDKVGDIPIESLPPEALENVYGAAGAGSAPVPSVVKPDHEAKATVEMKVVRYNPNTNEGQEISDKYLQENATQIDPVYLNDSKYKRYLPLKVSGSQFPLPDVPLLKERIVNSVVVLAPVDYDFVKTETEGGEERSGKAIKVQGVKFLVGDSLMSVLQKPSKDNYRNWLKKELTVPTEQQSVILLVTRVEGAENPKDEIFMYDAGSENVTKLRGELSAAFVEVAESNSNNQELGTLPELDGKVAAVTDIC